MSHREKIGSFTRLIAFVRHGETESNRSGKIQGSLDIPLNERGLEQAAQATCFLSTFTFKRIVTSPQQRACQTAQVIATKLNLPLIVDELLRERNLGVFEGCVWSDYDAALVASGAERADFTPENGESLRAVRERGNALRVLLQSDWRDQSLVIVSHGIFLSCFVQLLQGLPLSAQHMKISNASVLLLADDSRWWIYDPESELRLL